jgi:hypothetical protein
MASERRPALGVGIDGKKEAEGVASPSIVRTMGGEVDIRPLKKFAIAKCGSSSLLKKVLLVEPDRLAAQEFVGKMGTWLAILREESE